MKPILIILIIQLSFAQIAYSQLKLAQEKAKTNLTTVLGNRTITQDSLNSFQLAISNVKPFLFIGKKKKRNLSAFYNALTLYSLETNSELDVYCNEIIYQLCNYNSITGFDTANLKLEPIEQQNFKKYLLPDIKEQLEKNIHKTAHNNLIRLITLIDSVEQQLWDQRIERILLLEYHMNLQDSINTRLKLCLDQEEGKKQRLVLLRGNVISLARELKLK